MANIFNYVEEYGSTNFESKNFESKQKRKKSIHQKERSGNL